jgi:hypothetical protein
MPQFAAVVQGSGAQRTLPTSGRLDNVDRLLEFSSILGSNLAVVKFIPFYHTDPGSRSFLCAMSICTVFCAEKILIRSDGSLL